jgi:hypothetical protein
MLIKELHMLEDISKPIEDIKEDILEIWGRL